LWMYMPNISRPIRLTKSRSFMGSTFSNEDISDTSWENNYDAEITKVRKDSVLLVLAAKRRDVSYARIEMWVNEEKRFPVEAHYYGLSGRQVRKMSFSNVKEMAGRLRPLDMKMEDMLEEGAYTEVKLISMEELKEVPDYYFDQTQMGR
ncbi:MAG TPA: outer membrane lipoprotein-sorting protein, partial [bacterium]|nr:outer membrane lipoprotein-sorting protein [bacterium]